MSLALILSIAARSAFTISNGGLGLVPAEYEACSKPTQAGRVEV
jgi:hypothetical protein